MGAGLDHELEQGAHYRRRQRPDTDALVETAAGGGGRAARKPRVARCGLATRVLPPRRPTSKRAPNSGLQLSRITGIISNLLTTNVPIQGDDRRPVAGSAGTCAQTVRCDSDPRPGDFPATRDRRSGLLSLPPLPLP